MDGNQKRVDDVTVTAAVLESIVLHAREEEILKRPYDPPPLYIVEEVELGNGYHTLRVAEFLGPQREHDWSEPYKKTGVAEYRLRVVKVPYPPEPRGGAHDEWVEIGRRCSAGRRSMWMRLVFDQDHPSLPMEESVTAIQLRAGREGDDALMEITRDNPQFPQLLDLFLTAHFAATT